MFNLTTQLNNQEQINLFMELVHKPKIQKWTLSAKIDAHSYLCLHTFFSFCIHTGADKLVVYLDFKDKKKYSYKVDTITKIALWNKDNKEYRVPEFDYLVKKKKFLSYMNNDNKILDGFTWGSNSAFYSIINLVPEVLHKHYLNSLLSYNDSYKPNVLKEYEQLSSEFYSHLAILRENAELGHALASAKDADKPKLSFHKI